MNGFSTYDEGIILMIFDSSSERYQDKFIDEFPIYTMTPMDFEQVPKLKIMMDLILEQEFDNDRRGFGSLGSDGGSYWINIQSDEIIIQTGMSTGELQKYEDWSGNAGTYLLEYRGVIFHMGSWIA